MMQPDGTPSRVNARVAATLLISASVVSFALNLAACDQGQNESARLARLEERIAVLEAAQAKADEAITKMQGDPRQSTSPSVPPAPTFELMGVSKGANIIAI
jgi:hypothetical protein